jgi:hypothetical protein
LEGGLLSDDVEAPEEGGLIAVTFSLSIDSLSKLRLQSAGKRAMLICAIIFQMECSAIWIRNCVTA